MKLSVFFIGQAALAKRDRCCGRVDGLLLVRTLIITDDSFIVHLAARSYCVISVHIAALHQLSSRTGLPEAVTRLRFPQNVGYDSWRWRQYSLPLKPLFPQAFMCACQALLLWSVFWWYLFWHSQPPHVKFEDTMPYQARMWKMWFLKRLPISCENIVLPMFMGRLLPKNFGRRRPKTGIEIDNKIFTK